MVRSPSEYVWSLAVGLSLAALAVAVERTTDADRSYRAIRDSSDAATQALAQRWYSLVRLQDWTDATGRFKTRAKYVEHDSELAWVKLRVIQGSSDQRVVKDIQVPVEKLSPICQSRVRQIAFLSEKVSAAVAEEQAAEAGDAEPGAGETERDFSGPSAGPGREAVGGRAELRPRGPAEREFRGRPGERGSAERPGPARDRRSGRPVVMRPRGRPLPAMLPPLPGGAGSFPISAAMPAGGASRQEVAPGGDAGAATEPAEDGAAEPAEPADSQR